MHSSNFGKERLTILDSISYLQAEHIGHIVVSASHGGLSSGRYALRYIPKLVIFNDAGVGKDQAGIAALQQLSSFSIAAATVQANSARIGDGEDTWQNGILSFTNEHARLLGLKPDKQLKQMLEMLFLTPVL